MTRLLAGAALLALLLSGPAWSQPAPSVGDAELYVWTRATTSGKLADYQDYLRFYPDGRYAGLAKLRVQSGGGQPASGPAAPAPATANAPTPVRPYTLPPEVTLYHLDVTPLVTAAGQMPIVRTRGFMAPALFDLVVLVPAGARDFTPEGALDESQFRVKALANLYDFNTGVQLPAQPAGPYEVRYISRAYNPEGRLEVMARAAVIWANR